MGPGNNTLPAGVSCPAAWTVGSTIPMPQLQARSTHLNFHIGHEMVECLMRRSNSAKAKQDCPEKQSRVNSGAESHPQGSRIARKPWSVDKLASALFLALRRIL
jgi:hypothetical protein